MASRVTQRFPTGRQQEAKKDDTRDAAGNSITAPAVPASVVYKLLLTTFAMVTFPLGTYFATVNLIFRGNSTYAGALAAVVANVVLIGYVIVAMNEDQGDEGPAAAAAAAAVEAKAKKGE